MADAPCTVDAGELLKLIQSLGKASDALEPTMAVAAEMLVAEVQDRWRNAGDGEWPALSPATLEKRRGTIAQILQDTGRGIGSVQAAHGADYAEAASDVDYMKYHCGDGPRTKIPKRDPFDLSDAAQERVMEYVLADVVTRWTSGVKQ